MNTKRFLLSFVMVSAPVGALQAGSCCAANHEPAEAATAVSVLPETSLYHFAAEFTGDDGARHALADFGGDPVVLTMFFASCGYACPMLAHDMLKVQSTLPPEVRERVHFVMVSFDPERDSVERLQAFREQMNLAENWTLLRGEPGDVRTLAMLLGVKYRQEPSGDISHSNLITVLNASGEVAHQRTGLQGGLPGVSEALVRVAAAAR